MPGSEDEEQSAPPKRTLRDVGRIVMRKNRITKSQNTLMRLSSRTLGRIQNLCTTCRSLNLTAENFVVHQQTNDWQVSSREASGSGREPKRFRIGTGSGSFELGSYRRLWDNKEFCPFCRLVLSSVTDRRNMELLRRVDFPEAEAEYDFESATCFASWQIDGRGIVPNLEGNERVIRARTRRIRIHWEGGGFQDSYLILVPPPAWASGGLFLGRYIATARKNEELIKTWLNLCCNNHGSSCTADRGEGFQHMISRPYFGVLDVETMNLTPLPPDASYVALSYPWGDVTPYVTTLKNISEHRKPRGLEMAKDKFPKTIRDAVDLTKVLGMRYLWVDSLCIVQEPVESRSWELNSRIMDQVYGNAHLTICAADGEDANAGLTGLKQTRTVTQHIEDYGPGVRLMAAHLGETYIEESRWNKRAWTFQERLLSRRCLIFTKGRIYFQCREAAMSEDVISEDKDAVWSLDLLNAPLQQMREVDVRPLRVYSTCVPMYTDRDLGKAKDIVAAFTGIGNTISSALGGRLVYCLPDTHFDWALLWEPRDATKRRPGEFPSWSWCGWENSVMEYKMSTVGGCLDNLHKWLTRHTWIVWYIRDGHGILRLVWDSSTASKSKGALERRWVGYKSRPDNKLQTGGEPGKQQKFDEYGRVDNFPDREKSEFHLMLPEYPYSVSIADNSVQRDERFSNLQYLQFWTWSAFFRLELRGSNATGTFLSNPGRGLMRVGISDFTGDWCGTVVLDVAWAKEQDVKKTHEFIAISEAKSFDKDEYDGWTYYVPTARDQSEWDLYFVILVEREGDVSRRVGLGKVFQQAFQNSFQPGREWKEFILG